MVAVFVLGVGIGTWVVAPPSQTGVYQPELRPITAEVAAGELVDEVTGVGTVELGLNVPVTVAAPGGMRALVTATAPEVGGSAAWCAPVVGVAGRPVFLLKGAVPLHRSLRLGDVGDDVRRVQEALTACGHSLAGDRAGTLGAGTANAVGKMYSQAGYPEARLVTDHLGFAEPTSDDSSGGVTKPALYRAEPIGDEGGEAQLAAVILPLGEVVMVPAEARVMTALPLGADATAQSAVTLGVGAPTLLMDLTASEAAALREGQDLEVSSGDWSATVTMPTLGEPITREGAPRYLVQVPLPDGVPVGVIGLEAAYRQAGTDGGVFDKVVPAAAVYTQTDGRAHVIVLEDDQERRVRVDVLADSGGYCAVEGEGLSVGDKVVLGVESDR
jgi:hypothetical protein